ASWCSAWMRRRAGPGPLRPSRPPGIASLGRRDGCNIVSCPPLDCTARSCGRGGGRFLATRKWGGLRGGLAGALVERGRGAGHALALGGGQLGVHRQRERRLGGPLALGELARPVAQVREALL